MSISQTKKRYMVNRKNKSIEQSIESLQKIAQTVSKPGQRFEVQKFNSGLVIRYGEELNKLAKSIPNLQPEKKNKEKISDARKKHLENYRRVMRLMYATESFEAEKLSESVHAKMSDEEKAFYRGL